MGVDGPTPLRRKVDLRVAPMGGVKLPLSGTVEQPAASHYAVVNKCRLPQIFQN
jgi:hypothetical protein